MSGGRGARGGRIEGYGCVHETGPEPGWCRRVGGEAHYWMDEDGPTPDQDVRSDENEDEEEETHRPVVKSKLNNASLSGKKYLLLHHHQNLHPRLPNPLHGRVQ